MSMPNLSTQVPEQRGFLNVKSKHKAKKENSGVESVSLKKELSGRPRLKTDSCETRFISKGSAYFGGAFLTF